jgi:hypothetical protein
MGTVDMVFLVKIEKHISSLHRHVAQRLVGRDSVAELQLVVERVAAGLACYRLAA